MAMAFFNIIGFVIGVFNQPLSYVRVDFSVYNSSTQVRRQPKPIIKPQSITQPKKENQAD
jgi:uncharacterized membrane protein YciS (DUF1049 family)